MSGTYKFYYPYLAVIVFLAGCGSKQSPSAPQSNCVNSVPTVNSGSDGRGSVFNLDPMVSSGLKILSATSLKLDDYRSQVTLKNLGGHGLLEGKYVDVRNGLTCDGGFGTYSAKNDFVYPHDDARFQETMSYYYGDLYRSALGDLGQNYPSAPVEVVAHCELDDNASFRRSGDHQYVCLGDSKMTPGASYSDDAVVVVHELQHATTVNAYSPDPKISLNQLMYDEAGALNEAISDFMALSFFAPKVINPLDPQEFSRWALGTFMPEAIGIRGAHRCPMYDADYPKCGGFPGFSADKNTISYVYPDGMGWPYANNYARGAPGYAQSAFLNFHSQEEIHNAGVLIAGALWDAYDVVKRNHTLDVDPAKASFNLMSKAVIEAIQILPDRSSVSASPASYRGFASILLDRAPLVGMTEADVVEVRRVFTERGLVGGDLLTEGWAKVAAPLSDSPEPSPGLNIVDDPVVLKFWLANLGINYSGVTQDISTAPNGKLEAGEVAAVWFNIENLSNLTAGGVTVTVTSSNPSVLDILDANYNLGYLKDLKAAQIQYFKINGKSIVQSLRSMSASYYVPTGTTYFDTNPFFASTPQNATHFTPRTAIWVHVDKRAPAHTRLMLHVVAKPTNGEATELDFPVTIH